MGGVLSSAELADRFCGEEEPQMIMVRATNDRSATALPQPLHSCLVQLGIGESGKTTIVNQLLGKKDPGDTEPTDGDMTGATAASEYDLGHGLKITVTDVGGQKWHRDKAWPKLFDSLPYIHGAPL
jgi:hypothetical protein